MKSGLVAVRWLCAFRRARTTLKSLVTSLEYELSTSREVAFAFQPPSTKVGRAVVGLLVDTRQGRSDIHRRYDGDAWTEESGEWLRPTTSTSVPVSQSTANWEKGYDEANGYLDYVGVVVHRSCPKKWRNWARIAAARVGMPFLGTLKGGAS